jgi:Tetracyclin repressor-like, C-terminal domain
VRVAAESGIEAVTMRRLADELGAEAMSLGWCDDQAEFEFGLDLILDGLDRLRVPH